MGSCKKIVSDFTVLENAPAGSSYVKMQLQCDSELPEIKPGQFAELRVDNSKTTYLRRPFSIHDTNPEKNSISLLINKVGDGSRALASLAKGDKVNVMLPLGKGFTIPDKACNVLLVGGGVGMAPMLLLGKELSKSCNVSFLFGFRTKSLLIDLSDYEKHGSLFITTEDGSYGEKGFVTNHSLLSSNSFDFIYACGPTPMMKAVAAYAREKGTCCEVSLENKMACGLGACLCCVTQTTEGHKCVCTDGPVFNINSLPW